MTIEKIIKKAIEGGWNEKHAYFYCPLSGEQLDHAFNDPSFWQSLGKAMGWGEFENVNAGWVEDNQCGECLSDIKIPEWKHQWHRFINHLAEGKGAKSFFKDL